MQQRNYSILIYNSGCEKMTDKHQIKEIIEDFKEDLVRHRRNLHRIPEIRLKKPKTIEKIKKELDSSGIKYKETKTVDGVYG